MKQNIIALGLIASTGLTFFQPKANAWNLTLSVGKSIEQSQTISYTGTNEDCETEEVKTGDKKKCK